VCSEAMDYSRSSLTQGCVLRVPTIHRMRCFWRAPIITCFGASVIELGRDLPVVDGFCLTGKAADIDLLKVEVDRLQVA
jgi:hypothetical protein